MNINFKYYNMNLYSILNKVSRWLAWVAVFTLGLLYLALVHPVPAIVCLLLSLIFFPPLNEVIYRRSGFRIPLLVKISVFIIIFWFTLGVSDLGDMID